MLGSDPYGQTTGAKVCTALRANAEEFRKQGARSRFPEIQARLLRIAASSERLCNIAEGTGDGAESEGRAEPLEPVKPSHQAAIKRAGNPVSQARQDVAEAEARIKMAGSPRRKVVGLQQAHCPC